MKLETLAIIFVLIILPISLLISEYANTQMQVLKLEQLYDSRLITATEDALKAFQLNTFNDATSDIADSKISSIEASANAFYNAMESGFTLQGYSKEELQRYVPALVYTMYDGYYIYSPYTNITKTTGEIDLDSSKTGYGFKPYVYYSCRYVRGDIDVVINYSLDNYITIQGIIDGESVYKSGYLLTIDKPEGLREIERGVKYEYNGQEILLEHNLSEKLVEKDAAGNNITKEYKYIKLNGTKYYWNESEGYIFYLLGGSRVRQVAESQNKVLYDKYVEKIKDNTSAINYYRRAYEFSKWVYDELGDLEASNAVDASQDVTNSTSGKIFQNQKNGINIEYSGSNFNLHKKEVIKYSIESNLAVAIANFNKYTNSGTNFQMPKLKPTDWEMLQNEVSIISFLQGLNLGGKIYNGYTVVTNTKTEEVVKEERIYITTDDNGDGQVDYYHKINDKDFSEHYSVHNADDDILEAVLDLDFEIRKDGATGESYIHKDGLGCYTSIVGQESVDVTYDSIYEYLKNLDDNDAVIDKVKQLYYTALGRERWGTYKVENPSNIGDIIANMQITSDDENGGGDEGGENDEEENPVVIIEITDILTEPFQNGQWSNNNVKATITARTTHALGMEGIYFQDPSQSSEWSKINNIINTNQNGITAETTFEKEYKNGTIFFQAKDNAGNLSEIVSIQINNDTLAPVITNIQNENGKITVEAQDQYYESRKTHYSGISVIQYSEDNVNWFTNNWEQIAPTVSGNTATISGTWDPETYNNITLYIRAIDNAGNISEVKTITLTYEQVEYNIQIEDTDGISNIYNIPKNSNLTLQKTLNVTASNGNTEGLTIKYRFTKINQAPLMWITTTPGSTITRSLNYNLGHGIYDLEIQVVDSEGNVLVEKQQRYYFNGASIYA